MELPNRSHPSFEDEDQNLINHQRDISLIVNYDSEINLSAQYKVQELLQKIKTFIIDSKSLSNTNIQETWVKINRAILKRDSELNRKTGSDFCLNLIEHSHYIYEYKQLNPDITQQEINLVDSRLKQYKNEEYPEEKIYKLILNILKFISQLMVRWGIFDINNYAYRYKGRSLTVKVIDMKKINEQCVNAEICWFSYAIGHLPFFGKVDKVLLCYAEVLQHEIGKVIDFIRKNGMAKKDFSINKYMGVFKKNDRYVKEFYEILKGVELATRYFERFLIQEFIKIV